MAKEDLGKRIDNLEQHIVHLTNMQVTYMRMFGILMNDQEKATSLIDDIIAVVQRERNAGHEPLFPKREQQHGKVRAILRVLKGGNNYGV